MIAAHHTTPTGWADDRLMQAYDLIWEVRQDHKPFGIEPEFRALCMAVEAADDLLKQEQGA